MNYRTEFLDRSYSQEDVFGVDKSSSEPPRPPNQDGGKSSADPTATSRSSPPGDRDVARRAPWGSLRALPRQRPVRRLRAPDTAARHRSLPSSRSWGRSRPVGTVAGLGAKRGMFGTPAWYDDWCETISRAVWLGQVTEVESTAELERVHALLMLEMKANKPFPQATARRWPASETVPLPLARLDVSRLRGRGRSVHRALPAMSLLRLVASRGARGDECDGARRCARNGPS